MTEREELLDLLRRVRRRALVLGLARVALAALTGLAPGLWAGAALLPAVGAPWRSTAAAMAAAAALLGAAGLGAREWRAARPRRTPAEAARLLKLAGEGPSDLIRTGADLAAWGEGGAAERGASPGLAGAQVAAAFRAAAGVDWRGGLPAGAVAPWALRSSAVLLLCGAWALGNAERLSGAWRALVEGKPPAPVAVGNLRLRYQPPAYTGLAESRVEGSSGAVEGLRGTRVTLEGELSRAATGGHWQDSAGRAAPLEVAGRTFRVSWVLERSGTYALSFEQDGTPLPSDLPPKTVAILEDEPPKVELRLPAGDVEVRSDSEVEVRFTAADDYRVERAELVLQGETEVRLPVRLSAGRFADAAGRFLPLSLPKLGAGVHLRVDAWDSDAVSGPKPGSSRSVYVAFVDRKRLLAELEGLEERLLEGMLAHLGDHLEAPSPVPADLSRLRGRASDLLKLLDALSARVRQGAREEGAVAAASVLRIEGSLRSTLAPFIAGGGDRTGLVRELERNILFLDRLLRNLRMEETLALGEELAAVQRSLSEELEAGGPDRSLLDRLDRMQQLLAKMMERLARGSAEMPEAFANADAAQEAPTGEIQEALEKLRRALRAGDRQAAKRIAEELLQTLARWTQALERAAEEASQGQTDPLTRELARLEADARRLAEDQERILRETRGRADDASRRSVDLLRGELRTLRERLEQRLYRIGELARRTEALAPRGGAPATRPPAPPPLFQASQQVDAAISEVRRGLQQDLGKARSGAATLGEAFDGLRDEVKRELAAGDPAEQAADRYGAAARREIDELRRELDGFDQRRLQGLGPADRQALKRLGAEQGELGERTGGLGDRLEELARRSPFPGSGLAERARSARRAMEGAEARLGEPNPFAAVPPEAEALEGLSEIAKGIGDARGRLQQGGPGGFRLLPRPGPGGGSGREIDRGHVEIPKEAEAKELKHFREEVLKAMRRGGYPKAYEGEVERYYERLIR